MNPAKIICTLLLISSFRFQAIKAQSLNINADTVFVNMEAEVQIIFPEQPDNYSTVPATTQYDIWNVKTGINLIPVKADSTPATLLVSEGGRSHSFILCYRQHINYAAVKLYYDYSTVNKLARHLSDGNATAAPPDSKGSRGVASLKTVKDPVKAVSAIVEPTVIVDSSPAYYAILEEGEKAFKLQNYEEAKLRFTNAHTARPQDPFPLQRLEEIKQKTPEKVPPDQPADKYNSVMQKAGKAFEQKKYPEALGNYKEALAIKPGDPYATRQLQTITDTLLQLVLRQQNAAQVPDVKPIFQNEKPVNPKIAAKEDAYAMAIQAADDFFKGAKYDSSKSWYTKALVLFKRDWPKAQLEKINKIRNDQAVEALKENQRLVQQLNIALAAKKEEQRLADLQNVEKTAKREDQLPPEKVNLESVVKKEEQRPTAQLIVEKVEKQAGDTILSPAELRKNFNLAMANGRASFAKNDLENAKLYFESAVQLQPAAREPLSQLKFINDKLAVMAREAELTEHYETAIKLADSLVIGKSYEPATIAYREAAVIKPLELYPKKQLKYIQSEMALDEKRQRDDAERRYNAALVRADKAVIDKNYEEAGAGYSEALAIHPDNEYAKRRLAIISYQVEKIRSEKLSQDSVKEVIPVKKPKRKRSS